MSRWLRHHLSPLAPASLWLGVALLLAPALRAGGPCAPEPWDDVGGAVAGSLGTPLLEGTGPLVGGSPASFTLSGALPRTAAFLVVGLSEISMPYKGGVLVPSPDLVLGGVDTGPSGSLTLGATWPGSVPPGATLLLQWWIADAGAPFGLSASNAVRGTAAGDPGPGTLPGTWISGVDCGADPLIQVEAYDDDTYILRQSMCTNFEGPFMFLLFGEDRVLLHDTGATSSLPLRVTVDQLIDDWLLAHGKSEIELIVSHTHAHGDHVQGDAQFVGRPGTTVVGTSQSAVASFFGIASWPDQMVEYDLGCRTLDVIAIPGHQSAHIALYDRNTGLLLTGDTLYPGFLFISQFETYRASIRRLVSFVSPRPVTWVLGTHVEMTSTPGVAYPYGTSVQPDEHVLQLTKENLSELLAALDAMAANPVQQALDDFIITPF